VEHNVIFRENQELDADDINNVQGWTQDAIDHVVLDTLVGTKAYSGFALSKSAQTVIQTQPGRLYVGGPGASGAVYAREEPVLIDLFNRLPVSQKVQFAVVAWGTTVDEDIQPRDFLIDADTGLAEPQSVAMKRTRYANVDVVRGVESSDPQFPSVDATQTLIGYVLCDPTGIVSFQQNALTQVDNLALVAARVASIESWRGIISGQIDTLRTDLANLARQLLNYTPLSDFQKLVDLVNLIYAKVFQPGTFIYYGDDKFLDESQSATGTTVDGAYSAFVSEGLRFPGGGAGASAPLALFNVNEPVIQAYDTFILPKPSGSRVRIDCSFQDFTWIEERILSHTFWNFTCRNLTWSRWRYRCGPPFTPCPPSQVWWYQAQLDPTVHILSFATETWEVVEWSEISAHNEDNPKWPRHSWDRWQYYWRDYVDLPYWAKVYTDFSHSGNHVAQSFLNSQDGWLSGITVFSHRANFFQPMTLVITGCDDQGIPDHGNHTLRRVVLDATSIQPCYGEPVQAGDIIEATIVTREMYTPYASGVTMVTPKTSLVYETIYKKVPVFVYPVRINFPPVFLRAGQRYAINVHSTADHSFSVSDRTECYAVHQGHFWHSDGAKLIMWNSGPKHLRFMAHFLTWGLWGGQSSPGGGLRYEVQLQSLQLAGGIGSIDVLAEHIVPPATDLNYEVQAAGTWLPFQHDPNSPNLALSGANAVLPFRAVFTGTTDLMPGVSLVNSNVTLSRAAANSFHHISTTITLGTATNNIKVIAMLRDFVSAHHTATVSIHYGSTHKTADVVADVVLADGTLQRTATFNVTSVSSFQVEIDGTTDGTGDRFHVSQRIAYAT
jgi:hypothetical protein